MFKKITFFVLLLSTPSLASGGMPTSGQYVAYANVPVNIWDNLAIAQCTALEPSANCQNTLIGHQQAGITFSGPITISSGGTYSGNWLSTNAGTPAVTINTSQTVLIQNSIIVAPGNLVANIGTGSVELSHNQGWGTGSTPGDFWNGSATGGYLNIHDNVFSHVWGININGANGSSIVTVSNNVGYNFFGTTGHAVQIANASVPGALISTNTFINAPYESSIGADTINIFSSQGTSGAPIVITNNQILGAYAADPAIGGFSGCGILTDGGAGDTAQTAAQYINIYGNTVIDTTNCGIGIASGHNNSIYNNTIISSGIIGASVPVYAQNVGIYVYNIYSQSGSAFNNDSAHDNTIYWNKGTTLASRSVNNVYLPDCTGNCANNNSVSNAYDVPTALTIESSYVHPVYGTY